jgi:NAD-dependent dihydropyrimidine dehydrogenase PreA subunit
MNPGKVIDAYRMDEDLRLGTGYNPPRPEVKFAYKQDGGDFAHAALRCVGVGECRVPQATSTMCPSYQVTREEKHTTRGRARLLFEMLQGEVITDGWQSKEVAESLDLCLACKGCTNDCPVNVDIPTYKSEFLYHHYKSARRWRPRYAYAFGFIDQAARLASCLAAEMVPLAAWFGWWQAMGEPAHGLPRYGYIALAGLAMGLQSGAVTRLGVPGVTTVFIRTSSWIPRFSGRGGNEAPAEQGRNRRFASRRTAVRHADAGS